MPPNPKNFSYTGQALVTPAEIALIAFISVFCGALLGMYLRVRLTGHHLSVNSKDVIKLGMGLVATMTALVLGLMIATAKGSFDTQDQAIKHTAAKILLFDHVLNNYGPETKEIRELLRRVVTSRVNAIWPENYFHAEKLDTPEVMVAIHDITNRILQLSPQNDAQRWFQSQALQISSDISETRWLLMGSQGRSVSMPFLVVVVFWLVIIFVSFGLVAPRNPTVITVLFFCALSVAGSIFLILEMDQPFEGLIRVSSAPMRYTLSHLGQ